MDKIAKHFALIIGAFLIVPLSFAKTEIQDLRVTLFPQSTRIIFDLSASTKYKIFTLENPDRVVIDILEGQLKTKLNRLNLANSQITNIRYSQQNQTLRVVLDLQKKIKPSAFLLKPNQTDGNRLVIDLPHVYPKEMGFRVGAKPSSNRSVYKIHEDFETGAGNTPEISSDKGIEKLQSEAIAENENEKLNTQPERVNTRKFIVAIDPGHGGKDSGAVGRYRHVKEKDVVFKVATKLQSLINAQPGMHAFLIRSGDYYVDLRKRMTLAREKGADLFISVHADSFKDLRASGASVFVLSEKGASSEAARWLAERENSSDLVGGVKLEDKGDLLASVLIDLSQTASKSASHELANHLIANLAKVTDLHHRTVQRAGFMVLKSPDIPSVLVELGFISNQQGEERLLNSSHQQVLANALLSGIKTYVAKRPPPSAQDWTVAQR